MNVTNNIGKEYTSIGMQTIEGVQYDIVELPHVQYVNGFLARYILVPSRSLSKEVPANPE